MRILVSGAGSGLGRFLRESLGGDAYNRAENHAPQKDYDVIIHTAFDMAKEVASNTFQQYVDNTLGVTSRLLSIPHRKFVFISSVDVYPKDATLYSEDTLYNVADVTMLYGVMKLQAETLIANQANGAVILRASSLLGKYMRNNSILRILAGENPSLSVTSDSEYNFVLYEDVLALIDHCIRNSVSGIFNTTAVDNVRVDAICSHFGKQASFGTYRYLAGNVDNKKSAAIVPALKNGSLEQLRKYLSI